MPRPTRRWLFVPFVDRGNVEHPANLWRNVHSHHPELPEVSVCLLYTRLDDVQDDDIIYVLGHGMVGCRDIVNREEDYTEALTGDQVACRVKALFWGKHHDKSFKLKVYSCSAGDSGTTWLERSSPTRPSITC